MSEIEDSCAEQSFSIQLRSLKFQRIQRNQEKLNHVLILNLGLSHSRERIGTNTT